MEESDNEYNQNKDSEYYHEQYIKLSEDNQNN